MRSLLCLCLLVGITAFSLPAKPKPPAILTVRVYPVANGVRLKWVVTATAGMDSTTADVTGPSSLHKKYIVANKVDSTDYLAPAPGQSISGTVQATSWRRSLFAASAPVAWTYTEPDTPPPPPGVTVQVLPVSATVQPGQTFQFQASTNSGQPITWRVVGAGTVSSTGLYTAPL